MFIRKLHAVVAAAVVLLPVLFSCGAAEPSRHAGGTAADTLQNGHVDISEFTQDSGGRLVPVDLRGIWFFRRGDDPSYRLPETEDGGWEKVPVPLNWFALPGGAYTGYGWYRLHLRLPDVRPAGILGIELGWIDDADATYFNGRLVGTNGVFPGPSVRGEVQHAYDRTRIYPIDSSIAVFGGDNVLAVRVHSMDYDTAGIYKGEQVLGSFESLKEDFLVSEIILSVLASLYVMVGLYHGFLFIKRRKAYENLLFALFCVLLAVVTMSRGELKYLALDDFHVLKFIEYVLEIVLPALFFHFILFHFEKKLYTGLSLALDTVVAGSVVFLAASYPHVTSYFRYTTYVGYWLMLAYVAYSLVYLFRFRLERQDARVMLYGFAFFAATFVLDVVTMFLEFTIPWVAHYGFLGFVVSIVIGMGNRFEQLYVQVVNAERELRTYKDRLEDLVSARTGELLREIEVRKSAEQSLRDSRADLEMRNRLMERDLEHAQQVHRSFLPTSPPVVGGLTIDFRCIPYAMLGGDYFSFMDLGGERLGVFIGDVCGHGVSAALFLSQVKALADRTCSICGSDPLSYMTALNDDLVRNMPSLLFTALYGIITRGGPPGEMNFSFVRAGHVPPILYRSSDNSVELVESRGPMIGLMPDMRIEPVSLTMKKGDRIYLYTDGIPEVENRKRQILGYENLAALFHGAHRPGLSDTLDEIIRKCRDFTGGVEFADDIVLIGMEATGE
ncbi:MAG TPA: SpoIIE family protein phosphatase [Spirochaetota bacterium]|nr:SpoIIE family protein phosphatase [Spirochaetota bacterium]HOD15505.1 SpoIIE family protein phosphatase [Spirochaetota bacterium]HPN11990.1 SpoIIE family protein phosphatase [Spirochaetota bacterium]HQL82135.1 SpoIIE family protein phosphatase [Spirochaetota bacterium]